MASSNTLSDLLARLPTGGQNSEFLRALPYWLIPALVLFPFVYGSVFWNVVISLTDFEGLSLPTYDPSTFDLEMYRRMLSDPTFVTATKNTIAFMLGFTVACLAIGLLLAILVDRSLRFESTFRTIYLLPMSLSFVVTATVWAWMFNSQSGLINTTLHAVGLDVLAIPWISDPAFKLGAIVFALIWQFSGYTMVVYLSGLQSIPTAQYEAARTDGASLIRMYRRVVVPQLTGATLSAIVILVVFSMKAFDFIYAMFGKNPGPAADILPVMMYREAFASNNWAYGSAIAVILFLMALLVVAPYFYRQYQMGKL